MKTVLVIEDEEALQRMLSAKLSSEGLTVLQASNGQEGLRIIDTKHPDLILLDMVMPQMDGIHVLRALHSTPTDKRIPVIVLSNLSNDESVAESMENGVFDYLIKSDWSLEDVAKKVKEKLGI